eukprot:PhF_6_TR44202/c2_g1_i5/m.67838
MLLRSGRSLALPPPPLPSQTYVSKQNSLGKVCDAEQPICTSPRLTDPVLKNAPGPQRWKTYRLPTPTGPCCRKYFPPHILNAISKRLLPGDLVSVRWKRHEFTQESAGTVSKVKNGTRLIKYDNLPGLFPFPPADKHVRFLEISVEKKPRPQRAPKTTVLHDAVRDYAVKGGYARISFLKEGLEYKWVGVVTCVFGKSCLVRWLNTGRKQHLLLRFPPPKNANVTVQGIYFATPPPFSAAPTRSVSLRRRLLQETCEKGPEKGATETGGNVPVPTIETDLTLERTDKRQIYMTLNARSITDDARLFSAIALAEDRHVAVLVLTETRRRDPLPPIADWTVYETPADGKGNHGCAVILHKTIAQLAVKSETIIPHRVVAVHLRNHTVYGVYNATCAAPSDQDMVYHKLAVHMNANSARKIALGDLNARPREQAKSKPVVTASQKFEDFLEETGLIAVNVDFPGRGTPPTHKGVTLDYVLVDKRLRSSAKRLFVLPPPFPTDHAVLAVEIAVKWKAPARPPPRDPQHRPDLTAIANHPRRVAQLCTLFPTTSLVSALRPSENDFAPMGSQYLDAAGIHCETRSPKARSINWLECLSVQSLSPPLFLQSCRHALLALPGRQPKPRRATPHLNDNHIQSLLALHRRMQLPTDVLPNAVDAAFNKDTTELISMFSAHLRKNPRRAWDFVSAFTRTASAELPAESPEDRTRKFHLHFEKLFKSTAPEFHLEKILSESIQTHPSHIRWKSGPVEERELVEALGSMKTGKATGKDGVPAEILKVPALFDHVRRVLDDMLTLEDVFIQSLINPIPKKGDLSDTGNWRGIVLLPHVTKLYNRILMQRIRSAVDSLMKHSQNGFRKDRGTVHHIMALSILRDTALTKKYPLHGCFVDFSKAFDSVYWEAIVRRLMHFHAPHDLIRNVMKVYQGHGLQVRTSDGELSPLISQEVGVLQGDTLAPYLFILVLDGVLQQLPAQHGVLLSKPKKAQSARQRARFGTTSETRLTDLAYADDVVLTSHTPEGLQALFSTFEREALKVGLRVNMGKGKTERFVIGDDPGSVVDAKGTPIPTVTTYKYLGQHTLCFETEFSKRRACAWAAVRTFTPVWQSDAPTEAKRRLFSALVDPIFTYAMHTWPMTVERSRNIDGSYGRLLRFALGLPPACISRHLVHTESLYGNQPFVSSVIAERRVKFVGHVLRAYEHPTTPTLHPLAEVIGYDTTHLPGRRGPRITLLSTVFRNLRVQYLEQLLDILTNKTKALHAAQDTKACYQAQRWQSIYDRRIRHMLSYFEDVPTAQLPRWHVKRGALRPSADYRLSVQCWETGRP